MWVVCAVCLVIVTLTDSFKRLLNECMSVFSAGVHRVLMTIALAVSLTNGRQILFQIESCRVIYEININFSTICCTTAAACALDMQRFTAALQSALALSLSHTHTQFFSFSLSLSDHALHAKCKNFLSMSFIFVDVVTIVATDWVGMCVCVCKYDLAASVCVCVCAAAMALSVTASAFCVLSTQTTLALFQLDFIYSETVASLFTLQSPVSPTMLRLCNTLCLFMAN